MSAADKTNIKQTHDVCQVYNMEMFTFVFTFALEWKQCCLLYFRVLCFAKTENRKCNVHK